MRLVIRSSRLVLPPMRLVASATTISNVGKKTKNKLNAVACANTLQRGKTRVNVRQIWRERDAVASIASHYTEVGSWAGRTSLERSAPTIFRGRIFHRTWSSRVEPV